MPVYDLGFHNDEENGHEMDKSRRTVQLPFLGMDDGKNKEYNIKMEKKFPLVKLLADSREIR